MEEKLMKMPHDPTLSLDEMGFIRADDPGRDFDGLSLRAVLNAMRESSWDWPSAMFALGLCADDEDPHTTMHPGQAEIEWLRTMTPEENWEHFELCWDT